MKAPSYLLSFVALSGMLIGVACATSEAPIGELQPAEQNATEPPAKIPETAPPAPQKPPEKDCSALKCTKDEDCQNACKAAPSGAQNCCDQTNGKCWVNTAAVCPKTEEDAGQKPAY